MMMAKIAQYIQPNQAYCNERNKLIPAAERLALGRLPKRYTKDQHAYHFSLAMTELSEAAGLIGEGNVRLFMAKRVPFSKTYGS